MLKHIDVKALKLCNILVDILNVNVKYLLITYYFSLMGEKLYKLI